MSNNISDKNANEQSVIKIDLEELFNGNQKHPGHDHDPGTIIYYVIRVDKRKFELRESELHGYQILNLVGLTPDKYRLFELGEGQREVLPEEIVDFKKFGIERFKSVAKHANEGKETAQGAVSSLKREIELPVEDEQYLNRYHKDNWETIFDGNSGWILLNNFQVTPGYKVEKTTVAFMIPASYPSAEFDMMYFFPALERADGKTIGALSGQPLNGQQFQRWSRHRNSGEWRPGIDNIETHVISVQNWLIDELKK